MGGAVPGRPLVPRRGATVIAPVEAMRGGLVVSCQAAPGSPMDSGDILARICEEVVGAGARGIRTERPEHVRAVRERVPVPVIGLWKVGSAGVYITPRRRHVDAVLAGGADVVAVDATRRDRAPGESLVALVEHAHHRGGIVLGDVADFDDALAARDAGVDAISTTLSGYTGTTVPDEPDLQLVERLAARCELPIFAEGRIATPEQARSALDAGAWAVVVGTAITRPGTLAGRFAVALEGSADAGG